MNYLPGILRRCLLSSLLLVRALLVGMLLAGTVSADTKSADATTISDTVKKTITEGVEKGRPNLKVESVSASPIDNIYAVKIANGPTLYATADGRYFVLGDLFEVTADGFVNIAEKQREAGRIDKLASVAEKDMIIFAPKKQPSKAVIMVFTDVDCFYCQKLHREVPDLNRIGIEVRYLAFPRAGIGSDSYKKIASAWCAKDPRDALTKLKNREQIPMNVCPNNPVAKQYALGNAVGVSGTPALLTPEGQLMPGYMPALQLAQALGVAVDPTVAAELAAKQDPRMR